MTLSYQGIPGLCVSRKVLPSRIMPEQDSRTTWEHQLFGFVEQPLFIAALGILGGLVGLFLYAPVLVACGIAVLLAFHRAKPAVGLGPWTKAAVYLLACVIVMGLLYVLHLRLDRKLAESNTTLAKLVASYVVKIAARDRATYTTQCYRAIASKGQTKTEGRPSWKCKFKFGQCICNR